jgi:hypothetical protein
MLPAAWAFFSPARPFDGRAAHHTRLQGSDFGIGQIAPLAGLQIAQFQRREMRAQYAIDRKTQRASNTPDLALAALVHRDLKLCETRLAPHDLDFDRRGPAILEHDAAPPDVEYVVTHVAVHRHLVNLGVAVAWVRQPLGQLAIVGEQNQAFAVGIQPSDRVQVAFYGHQIAHRIAIILALRARGRHDLAWLVEHNVYALGRGVDAFAVDAHIVDRRVGFVAEDRLLAVDRDASLFDQGLGFPAGCDPRR